MTPLQKQFIGKGSTKGFQFTQLLASHKAYLYQINVNDTLLYYEVFKARFVKRQTRIIGNREVIYEERIKYPSDEDFGKSAWCYDCLNKAIVKFNKINSSDESK